MDTLTIIIEKSIGALLLKHVQTHCKVNTVNTIMPLNIHCTLKKYHICPTDGYSLYRTFCWSLSKSCKPTL